MTCWTKSGRMGKNKLEKWQELREFDHVVDYTDFATDPGAPHRLLHPKGGWSEWFGNKHPIVLELACGRGDYTIGLARRFPERNFVGIDIKGARIWGGARLAKEEGLGNVRFFRSFIDHIERYFDEGSVDEIWITFPDPFLRKSRANKRLTSPRFLRQYRKILRPGGSIHLKTDSEQLFHYTLEVLGEGEGRVLRRVDDVWQETPADELLAIQTRYERSHRKEGRTIRYLEFVLEWEGPQGEDQSREAFSEAATMERISAELKP